MLFVTVPKAILNIHDCIDIIHVHAYIFAVLLLLTFLSLNFLWMRKIIDTDDKCKAGIAILSTAVLTSSHKVMIE